MLQNVNSYRCDENILSDISLIEKSAKQKEPLGKYSKLMAELLNNFERTETIAKVIEEIIKDDTFIYLLANLNLLTFEESKVLHSIAKQIIRVSKQDNDTKEFIECHLDLIINNLFKNLKEVRHDFVVILVGKIFRKLFTCSQLFPFILSVDFFISLYTLTKSEKFILAKESFRLLFQIIESPKVQKDVVADFLSREAPKISKEINTVIFTFNNTRTNSICSYDKDDDLYYTKRETLLFLEKIMSNPLYENFYLTYTNHSDNLKAIMIQLNSKCHKIIQHAVNVLYFFFTDIECKHPIIKMILHANKENFYKFFEKHESLLVNESALLEKKFFILYELERLENLN